MRHDLSWYGHPIRMAQVVICNVKQFVRLNGLVINHDGACLGLASVVTPLPADHLDQLGPHGTRADRHLSRQPTSRPKPSGNPGRRANHSTSSHGRSDPFGPFGPRLDLGRQATLRDPLDLTVLSIQARVQVLIALCTHRQEGLQCLRQRGPEARRVHAPLELRTGCRVYELPAERRLVVLVAQTLWVHDYRIRIRGLTGQPKEMSVQVPLHHHCSAVRTQARASNHLQTMYSLRSALKNKINV